MLCKSLVNLTKLAYVPLNTSMYLIMTMEPQNKTCTTISLLFFIPVYDKNHITVFHGANHTPFY